jgi:hypothetical protein
MQRAPKAEPQRPLEPYEAPELLELGTIVDLTAAKPQGRADSVFTASA